MPEVADRRVLGLIAGLVVVVLVLNVVSAMVPGMDGALAGVPVVMAILAMGTVLILVRALRR
jgi:hypothetical protein